MSGNSRKLAPDYFKGILIILMVLAHCIQFFGDESTIVQGGLSNYINLTTFSGFLFCYGYVCNTAYFKNGISISWNRMLRSAAKTLTAYYISAFAYYIFIKKILFLPKIISNILTIRETAGWSEFLLSFAAVILLGLLLFPLMERLNLRIFVIAALISAAACFFPYAIIKEPLLAVFIGSTNCVTFPVVQYFLYFTAGVYFSRFQIGFKPLILLISLVCSVPCTLYIIKNASLPQRFPPSIWFVLGGAFFLYIYWVLCSRLETLSEKHPVIEKILFPLSYMGENSLFFLVVSNTLIFTLRSSMFTVRTPAFVCGVWLIILLISYYLSRLTRSTKISNKPLFSIVNAVKNTALHNKKQ